MFRISNTLFFFATERLARSLAQPRQHTSLYSNLGSGTDSAGYHQDKKLFGGKEREDAYSDQVHAEDTAAVLKVTRCLCVLDCGFWI